MARLRVGVIGVGTVAQSAHLPAIRHLSDELQLVAVADVRADIAQAMARRYGAEAWYVDYHELLARPDIDIVHICTPEFLHAEQTIAAAAADKQILCEKPMAATLDEADAMLAAARQAGVKLMIGHSRRFSARYRTIAAAIELGEIGAVRLLRENERRPYSMYESLGRSTGYWMPDGERPWVELAGYSQGAALTNAIHEMDLARWFIGQDAVSIYAEARTTEVNAEVPDFLTYTITFADGAIAAAEIVNQLPPHYPYFHMLEIFGADGTIQATDPPMSPFEIWTADRMRFPANFSQLHYVQHAYVREIAAFAAAVREDQPVPLDPWDARQALALSLAAVRSSETGQPISLIEFHPEGRHGRV